MGLQISGSTDYDMVHPCKRLIIYDNMNITKIHRRIGFSLNSNQELQVMRLEEAVFVCSRLLKKTLQNRGQRFFQGSWGWDCNIVVLVCIIVLLCDPFRNICTELK